MLYVKERKQPFNMHNFSKNTLKCTDLYVLYVQSAKQYCKLISFMELNLSSPITN